MHPSRRAQIALLIANKVLVEVLGKFIEYIDVFSKEVATKLLKHIEINNHSIDLKKDKQLLYKLIYSLKLVKLEILKKKSQIQFH